MKKALFILIALLAASGATKAQGSLPLPTAHGVELSWTAATPGSNPIAGYNIWRCVGTCTATGTGWTLITASPVAGTNYLDPAAGLSTNTTYSYVAYTQDTQGELSGPSNVATCSVGASFPTSPSVPGSLTAATK